MDFDTRGSSYRACFLTRTNNVGTMHSSCVPLIESSDCRPIQVLSLTSTHSPYNEMSNSLSSFTAVDSGPISIQIIAGFLKVSFTRTRVVCLFFLPQSRLVLVVVARTGSSRPYVSESGARVLLYRIRIFSAKAPNNALPLSAYVVDRSQA